MFNVNKIRKDFPIFQNNPLLIYFDNAATSQKPQCVIDAISDLYSNYNGNPHAEDHKLSQISTKKYNEAREKVAKFINADVNEICFTSGDTAGMNLIASSLGETLNEGDEILLTLAEHASNVLPWFRVCEDKKTVVNYIDLDEEGRLTLENVKKAITPKTKIISFANVTNVLGYIVDVKPICEFAHKHGIIVVIDAAQSVPHIKTDVKEWDCDFLVFSGHKICGPTGIGVLYGKFQHLLNLRPPYLGGGMNSRFDMCGNYSLHLPPSKFESGTVNLSGAIGLGVAIDYINSIGIENIEAYEKELRNYCVSRMKEIDGVKIYNPNAETGIITFNYKDVFAQDLASHFDSYNIAVRSGQHCAKILMKFLDTVATVRASLYFYNTKEEVDKFIEVLKKGDDYLDVYFK